MKCPNYGASKHHNVPKDARATGFFLIIQVKSIEMDSKRCTFVLAFSKPHNMHCINLIAPKDGFLSFLKS